MDERKRESIVAYLRRRMADFGIEPDDVAASLAADQEQLKAARYQDAVGNTWDGKGEAPRWVVQAMSAGQSIEHFSIANAKATNEGRNADWRNDPFAGTRLASGKPQPSQVS